jgi:hypothetical protein
LSRLPVLSVEGREEQWGPKDEGELDELLVVPPSETKSA